MGKFRNFFTHGTGRIIKWIFFILLALYVILVIVRVFQMFETDKTNAQVEKIHATKLTLDDVMGKNLPPDPGAEANKTVAGVDANENGIRDDVELAIFKEYPNSAKTRAALLQYALALQMETEDLHINTETATAIAEQESRSYDCIGEIVPRTNDDLEKIEYYRDFVKKYQLNTSERIKLKQDFDRSAGSFELQSGCDVDLKNLPN